MAEGNVTKLRADPPEPVDRRLVEKHRAMAEAVAPVIKDYLAAAIRPVLDRLAKVEQRQEQRSIPMVFSGVWSRGVAYAPGSVVQHDGTIWTCAKASIAERPGGPESPWQLLVKNGQAPSR